MTEKLDLILDMIHSIREDNTREHEQIVKRLDKVNGGFKNHESRINTIEVEHEVRTKMMNRKFTILSIFFTFVIMVATVISIIL